MDRYEKWAEYIMQHGDKILEKKKHRNMLIRRVSFSCASAFAAVIVGFFAWKSTPPKIELPSETIISESTTATNSTYTKNTSSTTTSNTGINKTITTTVHKKTETVTTFGIETTSSSKTDKNTTIQTQAQSSIAAVTNLPSQTTSIINATAVTTQTVPATTTTFLYHAEPDWGYVPPISFDNTNKAIEGINNSILSSNNDGKGSGGEIDNLSKEAYMNMYERFKSEGFIYQVIDEDSISIQESYKTYLFPFTQVDDIGIGQIATYNDNNYFVIFNYADNDLVDHTNTISEYINKRKESIIEKEIMIKDNVVGLYKSEDGQNYANSFIDHDHYYEVQTSASEEELIDFLNTFSYKKANLLI